MLVLPLSYFHLYHACHYVSLLCHNYDKIMSEICCYGCLKICEILPNSISFGNRSIIRSWKYLKVARKENLWAYGPKYRQSSREWPESWLELPTKFAWMTGKHGLISLKGPGGAQNATTRSCTEGVRMLNLLIQMLRFLLQYKTLPCVKKRWGWGLPL